MAEKKPKPRYRVCSKNTGAQICGPYDKKADAQREADRLNQEAINGRTAPSEHHPKGQALTSDGGSLMHRGELQEYEVVTEGGVILGGD